MLAVGPLAAKNCASCPKDYYCPEWGITARTTKSYTNYPCPAGYLCEGGAVHPSKRDNISIKLCPVGYFCDKGNANGAGTSKQQCPTNFYVSIEGQSACFPCPAGYSCPAIGTITPVACTRGSYCSTPTKTFDATLAATKANSADVETLKIDCPAGTFNSDELAASPSDCLKCPPGKWCEGGKQSFSGLCDKGYVCTGGQATATPSGIFLFTDYADNRSGRCPIGHYCPTGSSFPVPCPAGTYQDTLGQWECKSCDIYKYCGRIGLTVPEGPCALGYECLGGAIYAKPNDYMTGQPCDKGTYCQGGKSTKCPGGYYAPVQGMGECLKCPPGSYCDHPDGTSKPENCPTAHYCPLGT